ncbi:MAG: single-stranded DNA-binding protein [Lachnospiraceae bacterium]|nr:single-stranded DNA-binding protein [Lachnospiraceae bacterium]
MNKVILMGRLTRDPEVRYTTGDQPMAIARYTLAVDRRQSRSNNGQDEQNADFITCVAFGRTGEFAEKYLHKGTKIAITGRIQTGSYTNKDGVKVYTTEVVVEDHEFCESRNAAGENGGYNGGGYNNAGGNYNNNNYGGGNRAQAPSGAGDGFMNIPDGIDEELPFN